MDLYASRSWMYNRNNPGRRGMREEFVEGVTEFIAKVELHDDFIRSGEIKCPCVNCKCTKCKSLLEIEMHLYQKGFMPNYFVWIYHGESRDLLRDVNFQNVYGGGSGPYVDNDLDNYRMNDMVNDAFGMYPEKPSQPGTSQPNVEHVPNDEAKLFYMYTCRERGTKPDWIYPDKWELLLQYWQSPEFQRKSAQAKKNRASEAGGSLHTGGSVSAATQRMREEKKERRQIPVPRLFKSRHILKNKKGEEVWVEPRAQAAYEKAQAAFDARNASQASDCGSSTPAPMTVEEETALWLDVNGGPKKGCAYELGSMFASDRLNPGLFGSYSTPASSVNPSTEAKLLEQIEELRRQREEDRVRNEANMAQNEANMAAMRQMMQDWMSTHSDTGKKKDKGKGKSKSKNKKKSKRRVSSSSESESSSEATQ